MGRPKKIPVNYITHGVMRIKESVDITDPCYKKDVWCRMDAVKVRPGPYVCQYSVKEEVLGYERVARIRIFHQAYTNKITNDTKFRSAIGEIGVDAGVAGFFENKPDFTRAEWNGLCKLMRSGNVWLTPLGFWSQSGYGDGSYEVRAKKTSHGDIIGLEIIFTEY